MNYQPGIIAPITDHAIFIEYGIINAKAVSESLEALSEELKDSQHIVGIGSPAVEVLNSKVPGLNRFPLYSKSFDLPVTQQALFVVLQGDELAPLDDLYDTINKIVSGGFALADKTRGYKHQEGRDLTGYEYGTANPSGEESTSAAIVSKGRKHLNGSSFVSIQRWVHNFHTFNLMIREEQDKRIGRYQSTNQKFNAPKYAHVVKTAQESFDLPAHLLRRSMPWSDDRGRGLYFVAFSSSLRVFDTYMKSMIGFKDDIIDGLFDFTMPATGANYWCPPIKDGKLDFSFILT